MALQQLGINVGDLSGAEAIQKLNASPCFRNDEKPHVPNRRNSSSRRSSATIPALLDKSGNERLIGMFSQLAKREADLGKLARQKSGQLEQLGSGRRELRQVKTRCAIR
jgi:hypothetical protein